MKFSQQEKEYYMQQALLEAKKAAANEDVPIGVIIVCESEIIARSFNRRELDGCATHHAEICAIEAANEVVGNWRLLDCALFVTIEPCVMCAGAISLARIPQVYFGATNPKFGAAGSLYQILEDRRLNHRVIVESGILKTECASLMQDFFQYRRKRKKEQV
ncbi:tRNA adenosine(34) deaminase TadA [Lactococcus garvieae]|uniref:tRNA-specific adenosine deaminase n=1 Tax=Lactococcus garvieae TaxID=1363 RepID=A0AA46TXH4_9LACT|nr:tRNA adenosine(34) deaminase TadA [Lactococcus garvieae]UYT11416.1 tRNA adenosine(34) deaminase TadA [Lactococcus garvieae]UYT11784.1 tRNA adenosine(34) deaminase TadA [Lactococcus garvieae]